MAAVTLFVVVLGIAGNFDRKHEIARNMDPRIYDMIRDSIHGTACDIADEYMARQEHYDSIARENGWVLPYVR